MLDKKSIVGLTILQILLLGIVLFPLSGFINQDDFMTESTHELASGLRALDFSQSLTDDYFVLAQSIPASTVSTYSLVKTSLDGGVDWIREIDHPKGYTATNLFLIRENLILIPFIGEESIHLVVTGVQGEVLHDLILTMQDQNTTDIDIRIQKIFQVGNFQNTFAIQTVDNSIPCRFSRAELVFISIDSSGTIIFENILNTYALLEQDIEDTSLCDYKYNLLDVILADTGEIKLLASLTTLTHELTVLTILDSVFYPSNSPLLINASSTTYLKETSNQQILLYQGGGFGFSPQPKILMISPGGDIVTKKISPSSYTPGSSALVGSINVDQSLVLLTQNNWLVELDKTMRKIWEFYIPHDNKIGVTNAYTSNSLTIVMIGNDGIDYYAGQLLNTIILTTLEIQFTDMILVQYFEFVTRNLLILVTVLVLSIIFNLKLIYYFRSSYYGNESDLYPKEINRYN